MDQYLNKYFKGDDAVDIKQFVCNDPILYKTSKNNINNNQNEDTFQYEKKSSMCEKLINNPETYGVLYVYISRYNVNDIKACTTSGGKTNESCGNQATITSLQNVDTNFIYYLRTISSSNRNETLQNAYRLIVEYREKESDYENIIQDILLMVVLVGMHLVQ